MNTERYMVTAVPVEGGERVAGFYRETQGYECETLHLIHSIALKRSNERKGLLMDKTKIEWCDSTWNPITGCKHGCGYCYARGTARRFEGVWDGDSNRKLAYLPSDPPKEVSGRECDGAGLKYCVGSDNRGEPKLINAPYPYGFHPTLHRHRLEAGARRWKRPRTIFVGSMTDLFGNWIPDRWIEEVFETCAATPQHRYLFLTKNPERYTKLLFNNKLPRSDNFWFGSTITTPDDIYFYGSGKVFLSIEPLLEPFDAAGKMWTDWVIIGAETGSRKSKVLPKREWVKNIVRQCRMEKIPVFMKNSLASIWGEPLIQEYPR